MLESKGFVGDLVGKTVLVKTHWGTGTQDASLKAGEYKGVLVGYDGKFIKLQYEIRTFTGGSNVISTDLLLINTEYIVSINEYKKKND